MLTQSETLGKLFSALVKAQAEFRNPPKESVNPHFKSRFADLATVLDTVKPVLSKHGLFVSQMPCEVEGIGPGLATTLLHESGEYMRGVIALRPGKLDPQGIGAALTYARRYGLQAVLGITADDDDDGNHASRPPAQQRQEQRPAQPQPPKLIPPQGGSGAAPPLWDDADAVFAKLQATNRAWPQVVTWLNEKHGGKYKADAGFFDVSEPHRKVVAELLGRVAK